MKKPIIFLICWLLTSCQSSPPKYPSIEISRVISGQLVEWIDKSQQPPIIHQGRLAGIEAPDQGQEPWGDQAKQRLIQSIGKPNKDSLKVEFDTVAPDSFGRLFLYLWKDGELLNERLVRDGCVLANMPNPNYPNTTPHGIKYRERFIRGSQYARLMGEGIWNPDRPMRMTPAEFRKEAR